MKISGGLKEKGIVVGNAYDKYGSANPIVKIVMRGFQKSISELVAKAAPKSIHEIGCGEGYWVLRWTEEGFEARGCDFSSEVIDLATENAKKRKITNPIFQTKSIYELDAHEDSADLVVCCEVLEHLEHPEVALQNIQKLQFKNLIISVPREPLWRILNLFRGRYISELGNTPGHIQHWSKNEILNLVSKYFEVLEVKTPIPWTMLICRKSR